MKTIDSYLFNKDRRKKVKTVKNIKVPKVSNEKKENEGIHINFPDEEKKDSYPNEKKPLIQNKAPEKINHSNIIQENIDLIKRKERYEKSPGFVMKCSECGTICSYVKKTSNRSDITNVECINCFREKNIRGYLSFSDNPFYQRTKDNAEWFDNNIKSLMQKERPRIIKF